MLYQGQHSDFRESKNLVLSRANLIAIKPINIQPFNLSGPILGYAELASKGKDAVVQPFKQSNSILKVYEGISGDLVVHRGSVYQSR